MAVEEVDLLLLLHIFDNLKLTFYLMTYMLPGDACRRNAYRLKYEDRRLNFAYKIKRFCCDSRVINSNTVWTDKDFLECGQFKDLSKI